ncbi:DUF7686 domain-containing protein [Acetobacterium bakii]|uniref:Uncharacterized protein n=1 Tax=Acetobacterium bakii TaxID=52689 RepID=A0A0L6TXM0_9FIRM|nr:hypothetical protein [Acetobacterium bakii]KNZ40315.1 hypothetical protein AKG39_18130 [Acetobacterium bakii]
MKCNKCKVNEATIHIINRGDFCLACHHEIMDELPGMDNTGKFSEIVTVKDMDGQNHQFEIINMVSADISVWQAMEICGGYEFMIIAKPAVSQLAAYKMLIAKIERGLSYRTLSCMSESDWISNAICIDEVLYDLNSIGTCQILADEFDNASLMIDGKAVGFVDFGRALTAFEGFNLDFQIRDISDDVLGKETVLRQVSIDPEVIFEHVEKTLGWFLEDDFLSYKLVGRCEDALFERIDELKLLHKYGSEGMAKIVGERIKERLLAIEHDDDHFPEYLVRQIDRMIES